MKLFSFTIALCLVFAAPAKPSLVQTATAVLGGRAEISEPEGYRRLPPERAVGTFQDLFYIDGLGKAYRQAFPDRDAMPHELPMSVAKDARAHFAVIELPLPPDGGSNPGSGDPSCPFQSSREGGIAATAHNPLSGYSHCLGIGGAMAYLVCDRQSVALVCVFGLDYIEFIKAEQRGGIQPPGAMLSDAELLETFEYAGNVHVLEAVLKSFRYR